uniref:Family with sequence similarity 219 member A n=1 Tax=Oryctolagus cuniculus TaxID=9986 RepID=G1U1V3_RABIT
MMEEIDRFQVPTAHSEMQPLDPAAASISDGDCDAREGESVAMNYKPSPLQVKLEKQRELARKGSLKNGSMGSPVNQQPKKNNVMARTRLVVPNKGYSSLDQSPDEKPLVALDTDRCVRRPGGSWASCRNLCEHKRAVTGHPCYIVRLGVFLSQEPSKDEFSGE